MVLREIRKSMSTLLSQKWMLSFSFRVHSSNSIYQILIMSFPSDNKADARETETKESTHPYSLGD